ncbi:MAG: carnitine dehydratase [Rhodospirillaceae bacterium TMED167]|nr:carnitine dehydratase [Rhodospirillaceae bacterium]OUW29399.1 MAG: carnitine dehydratase [Rhodospirillaceae bacterium TMED167]
MGPLSGYRIIELGGLGPAPMCGLLLADLGAEVILVERPGKAEIGVAPTRSIERRGKRSIELDLKAARSVDIILKLVETADGLIEGFRPGVAERLGLGPADCHVRNPKLVYGRVTGWGQDGPLAQTAGHDINYISLAGALDAIGPAGGSPLPPLNLVGDYGGGAMYLACGLLAGLLEAHQSGQGQVIDAAMMDGALFQMSLFFSLRAGGRWNDGRGNNHLDGAAPYYRTYETKDLRFVAVGALEQKFYNEFVDGLGLAMSELPERLDPANWGQLIKKFEIVLKSKTQQEWIEIFNGSDACVTPVLPLSEVKDHPHTKARRSVVENAKLTQPSPGPRFSRTQLKLPAAPENKGASTQTILRELGLG